VAYYISPVCRQAGFQAEIMTITVYAIYDDECDEIYVGMTNNLERRLEEHKRGQSFYTRKFKNSKLIYKETHINYKEGRKREKYLKNSSGKEFLRKFI